MMVLLLQLKEQHEALGKTIADLARQLEDGPIEMVDEGVDRAAAKDLSVGSLVCLWEDYVEEFTVGSYKGLLGTVQRITTGVCNKHRYLVSWDCNGSLVLISYNRSALQDLSYEVGDEVVPASMLPGKAEAPYYVCKLVSCASAAIGPTLEGSHKDLFVNRALWRRLTYVETVKKALE